MSMSPEVKRRPWEPRPRTEPGPRMQNVRISDTQYGTLLTGKGAKFDFVQERDKGNTFDSVYVRLKSSHGGLIIARFQTDGGYQYVRQAPNGELRYSFHEARDLYYREGELEHYFEVGKNEISEILVVGWGDIPKPVLPMLPYNSLANEFYRKSFRALGIGS